MQGEQATEIDFEYDPTPNFIDKDLSQTWLHKPVITALWKADAGELEIQAQPRQLRDFARPYLKIFKKVMEKGVSAIQIPWV